MPRLPRVMPVGSPQHVIQRGNNRGACFFAEADYAAYLHWLRQAAQLYRVAVHAYVLMTNHVHLLVTPDSEGGISKLMQYLGRHYVHYINKAYRRSGTLWERRFRASLVESEEYLLALYRYIELNPVRAGMVGAAEDYRWSSAYDHLVARRMPGICDHELFMRLGEDGRQRTAAYRALLCEPLSEELLWQVRAAVNQGAVLGGERFKDQIEEQLQRRVRAGRPGRKPKQRGVEAEQLVLDV